MAELPTDDAVVTEDSEVDATEAPEDVVSEVSEADAEVCAFVMPAPVKASSTDRITEGKIMLRPEVNQTRNIRYRVLGYRRS